MRGKGRLQQVVDWCGGPSFDGCIVFDECHKAKNFVPGKEAQSTKVSTVTLPPVALAYANHPDMQAGLLSMWASRACSHPYTCAYKAALLVQLKEPQSKPLKVQICRPVCKAGFTEPDCT